MLAGCCPALIYGTFCRHPGAPVVQGAQGLPCSSDTGLVLAQPQQWGLRFSILCLKAAWDVFSSYVKVN